MKNAGKAGIRPRGDYDSSATYERLDAVMYNGTMYIAKKDVPQGTLPTDTEYWMKSITGGTSEIATTENVGIVKPDGTTITIDEDGTIHGQSKVDEMTGATADKDGTSGMVPAPTAGQENHVLKGNGTWEPLAYDSELSAESENAPQTKVVDAKTKEIETNLSQLSNPNLLINPDFKINQRDGKISLQGVNVYSDEACANLIAPQIEPVMPVTKISNGNYIFINADGANCYVKASDVVDGYCENGKYTVDRWVPLSSPSGYIKVINDGVQICGSMDFTQRPEYGTIKFGETYTVSASINSVVYSWTFIATENQIDKKLADYDDGGYLLFKFIGNWGNHNFISILQYNSDSTIAHTVNWMKLEKGSVATPFIPPDPASELLKCQRYYEEGMRYIGCGPAQNKYGMIQGFAFKSDKRIVPTVKLINPYTKEEDSIRCAGNAIDYGATARCSRTDAATIIFKSDEISPSSQYEVHYIADAEIY